MTMYPNSRIAPHQERAGAIRAGEHRLTAAQLGADFEPNRQQRRDYVRHNQSRRNRMYLIGFGRWRRHNAHDYESVALQTAIRLVAPRAERRPAMIREAKIARWLRRQQHKQQTLGGAIRSAAKRIIGAS